MATLQELFEDQREQEWRQAKVAEQDILFSRRSGVDARDVGSGGHDRQPHFRLGLRLDERLAEVALLIEMNGRLVSKIQRGCPDDYHSAMRRVLCPTGDRLALRPVGQVQRSDRRGGLIARKASRLHREAHARELLARHPEPIRERGIDRPGADAVEGLRVGRQ